MCKTFPKPLNDLIPPRIESVNCLLGDFSSAWDDYSQRNLYASGPSTNDLTQEYSPPEVLLQQQGSSWSPFSFQNPYSYDSWSLGVVVSLNFMQAWLIAEISLTFCHLVPWNAVRYSKCFYCRPKDYSYTHEQTKKGGSKSKWHPNSTGKKCAQSLFSPSMYLLNLPLLRTQYLAALSQVCR